MFVSRIDSYSMIVTAMLLLGGAAVANSLTGMDIYAACFLIPLGIILTHRGMNANKKFPPEISSYNRN